MKNKVFLRISLVLQILISGQGYSLEKPSKTENDAFYILLDDILTELAFDLSKNPLAQVKSLGIISVSQSLTLQANYRDYLDSSLAECILSHAKIPIKSCNDCKTMGSIEDPKGFKFAEKPKGLPELDFTAQKLGVSHFMKVAFIYDEPNLLLGLQVFETGTNNILWAKTYNTKTLKIRLQKQAIDFSEIQNAKLGSEYVPLYRTLIGLGVGTLPNLNISDDHDKFLSFKIRMTEKLMEKKHEFGIGIQMNSLLKDLVGKEKKMPTATTSSAIKPYKSALGLQIIYAYNFISQPESYQTPRLSFSFGLGSLLASNYLAPSVYSGIDLFIGRTFAISLGFLSIGQSTILLNNEIKNHKGGSGFEFTLSYHH